VRLAVLQAAAAPGDVPANLARLDAALAAAAAAGADLLVTPELFLTGYAMDADAAAPGGTPASLADDVRALVARHRVALVWSQPLDGAIAALAADATGAPLGTYRKVHLYGAREAAAFTAGAQPPLVVDVAGVRVGVAVCYDVEFPETARAAALAGAQVLAVPTAMDDAHVASVLLPARALENGVVLAYANHPAPGAVVPFCGRSVVLGADGAPLAAAAAETEELLVADVDVAALDAARARNPYLGAARPQTYRTWSTP